MLGLLDRLFGPIFAKEAVEIARRFRYYATRSLLGILLLIGAYRTVEAYGDSDPAVGVGKVMVVNPGSDPVREAKIAEALLDQVAGMQILAIIVLTPIFLCGTVAGERRNGTLELLFTTHLTDRQILWGKFGSRVAVMLLVLFGGIPVVFLLTLLGGIDLLQLLIVEAISLAVLIFVAGITVNFSAVTRTPLAALMQSYGATFALSLVAAPLVVMLLVVAHDGRRNGESVVVGLGGALLAVVSGLLINYLVVAHAAKRMRETVPDAYGPTPSARDDLVRSETEEAADLPPSRGAMWGPLRLAVDRNDPPLRENLWIFGVLLAAFAVCTLMIFQVGGGGAADRLGAVLIIAWLIVIPATLIAGVTNPLFSRRPGFFDLLLGTTLDQGEILTGAVWVGWPMLLRLYVVPWLLGVLWIGGNPAGIVLATLVGSLFGAILLLVGNVVSLADHRPHFRLGATLLFLAVPTIALWMYHSALTDVSGPLTIAAVGVLGATVAFSFRRSTSALGITAMLLGTYFAFCSLSTMVPMTAAQVVYSRRREVDQVVELANPFKWLWLLLWPGERGLDDRRWAPWSVLYIANLVAYGGWLWWWASRNFDRLVGRTRPQRGASISSPHRAGRVPAP